MSYNRKQFESSIQEVLSTCPRKVDGESAVQLLLGTAAQESGLGTYLEQMTGPARGAFQVEPATAQWLEDSLPADLSIWLKSFRDDETIKWALEYRLDYGIACCRMRYLKDKQPIPADLAGQAAYWKRIYNTHLGKGTVDGYIVSYKNFIEA